MKSYRYNFSDVGYPPPTEPEDMKV